MFYPQTMTEVELIVPSNDLLPVTKAIRGLGVFHQVDSSNLGVGGDSRSANPWQEKATALTALERRIQAIMQTVGLEEGRVPEKESEAMVDTSAARETVDGIEAQVKQVTDRIAQENRRLEQLNGHRKELETVAEIDLDVESFQKSRYLYSVLGTIPLANIKRLEASLSRIPHVFLPLHQDTQKSVVWVGGSPDNADVLERAWRAAFLIPLQLPEEYKGKPAQVLKSLKEAIQESEKCVQEYTKELEGLRNTHRQTLQKLYWEIRSSRMLTDAILRYGKLKFTYIIVGWVPAMRITELSEKVKQASKDAMLTVMPPTEGSDPQSIPVAMSDSKFLKPFQVIVTSYSRPRYNEIDPTFLIAITFPVLFGAMFGDVGQGIVLAIVGWLAMSKKVKALNFISSLGGLIMACGIMATLFGFLYGSFFGFEEVIHPIWLHPLTNIMTVLMVAIGAGVFLLTVGFGIGMYNAYRTKEWGHFFFDRNGLAGFVLYWSLLLVALNAFAKITILPTQVLLVLIVAGVICIALSEVFKHLLIGHRPLIEGGIGTYAIQAFFEVFETFISFLSNTLSYVRVGAFAVAHGGLSSVIFLLAVMAGGGHEGGIGYWLVILVGNLFIIGFEGLIVGIQTMRLEYYEFFSKFFKGGGSRYEPLTVRSSGD